MDMTKKTKVSENFFPCDSSVVNNNILEFLECIVGGETFGDCCDKMSENKHCKFCVNLDSAELARNFFGYCVAIGRSEKQCCLLAKNIYPKFSCSE